MIRYFIFGAYLIEVDDLWHIRPDILSWSLWEPQKNFWFLAILGMQIGPIYIQPQLWLTVRLTMPRI